MDKIRRLTAFFFPPVCPICGKVIGYSPDKFLCDTCALTLHRDKMETCGDCCMEQNMCTCPPSVWKHDPVEVFLHVVSYRSATAQGVLFRLKQQSLHETVGFVAQELSLRLSAYLIREKIQPSECVITFIPRSPGNVCKYGFDQSRRVAGAMSRQLGMDAALLLHHISGGGEQKMLSRRERQKNALEHLRLRRGVETFVHGKTVILIDDVLTTGASMRACARLLHNAGAIRVVSLTLAKTDGKLLDDDS